jgi:hypothetical protein
MYTSYGSLIPLAMWMERKAIWDNVSTKVTVPQKTMRYHPTDKLLAVVVAILSGARRLVEANTRLRCDHALRDSLGLSALALSLLLLAVLAPAGSAPPA